MNDIDYTNPWAAQRAVMQMSDQALPERPTITATTLLYFALCLEELGEVAQALEVAIESSPARSAMCPAEYVPFSRALWWLRRFSKSLAVDSRLMRDAVAQIMPEGGKAELPVHPQMLTLLADGQADLMVVAAGLGESSGIPGAAVFAEVVRSNISKANPESGKIDKTADGKWIKGPAYLEPDVRALLVDYAARREGDGRA